MAPVPIIPPFNMAFTPRPSVMNSSTIPPFNMAFHPRPSVIDSSTIPPFNMDHHPRPSVMDTPHTNKSSSTITRRHIPNNIVSHAVFFPDSEPLDPSYRRILESPIHLRSIADTYNLENHTANTTFIQGEAGLQNEMSPAIMIIITVVVLVVLFLGIFGFDTYLSHRERMEKKKQKEEERNDAERKEGIQKGEFMEIDLGELGVAVAEHVEYADVESGKEAAKERRRSGFGWMTFWR